MVKPPQYLFPHVTVKQEGVKCIKCHCSKNVMTHPSCPSVCSTNNIRTYNIVVQNICTWNILVNICSYDICTDIAVWNNCQWQNWSLNTISGTDNTAVWNICTDNIVAWELGNLSTQQAPHPCLNLPPLHFFKTEPSLNLSNGTSGDGRRWRKLFWGNLVTFSYFVFMGWDPY